MQRNHDILIALVFGAIETGRGRSMLKRVYIEITDICNLACSFCPGTKREKKFMTPEEFKIIATKLRARTEYVYLHVMGEPLLHPQLEEILDIATELGFKINITTNGTLLSKKGSLLRKYSSIRKVSVSLHSYEGNHAHESGEHGEQGSRNSDDVKTGNDFTDYLENVWNFAAGANCIVALRLWNEGGANKKNNQIIDFLSDKSGLKVRELPETANGRRLWNTPDGIVVQPGGNKVRDYNSNIKNDYNSRIYLESATKFTWPAEQPDEQPVLFCHGLSQQLAVLCDGTVVPCCLDGEGTIALGNLLQNDLESILASERAKRLVQGFTDHCPSEELCRHCDYATRF